MLGIILWKNRLLGRSSALAGAATGNTRYQYGSDQHVSPTAMLLTGGIVALVGMGLMTMNTNVVKKATDILIMDPISMSTPPPPPPPEPIDPVKEPHIAQKTQITAPIPINKIPTDRDLTVAPTTATDLVPLGPTVGNDPEPASDPIPIPEIEPTPLPPPADPVLTKAMRDPRYAGNFQPDYPAAMQRQEKEGTVTVRVLVGTNGRVKQVEIVSASDPAFGEATRRQAMSSWRFKPATRDGVPQEGWITQNVQFKLDQA